jgi:hypothetical protein
MEMQIVNSAKLALAVLAAVGVLDFASAAQGEQSAAFAAGDQPALAGPGKPTAGSATPGKEGSVADNSTPAAKTAASPIVADASTPTAVGEPVGSPTNGNGQPGPSSQSTLPSAPKSPGGAPNVSAAATPASPSTGPPEPTSTPEGGHALTSGATPQASGATPQAGGATPQISAATPQASGSTLQASGSTPQATPAPGGGSASGTQNTGVAESNATTEGILQIQISGCAAYCKGISQIQAAEQLNMTIQALEIAPRVTTGSGAQAGYDSPATSTITQIQLGCLAQCSGTSTTDPAILASYQQALEQLLLAIAPSLPVLTPTLAAEQNAVDQMSQQWQDGQGPTLMQTQNASQLATTVQIGSAATSLAADLQAALGLLGSIAKGEAGNLTAPGSSASTTGEAGTLTVPHFGPATGANGDQTAPRSTGPTMDAVGNPTVDGLSGAAVAAAVNQTAQGIWQLQIGCLFFCVETQQYQQAHQANTTIEMIVLQPGSPAGTGAAMANLATQLVWQVQIGCIFSCFDTTQEQTAASQNTLVVIESQRPPAPGVPKPPSTPPGGVAQPSPAPTEAGDPTPPGGGLGLVASGSAGAPPTFPAMAWSTAGGRPSGPSGSTGEVPRGTTRNGPSPEIHTKRSLRPVPSRMTQPVEPTMTATTVATRAAKASTSRSGAPPRDAGWSISGSLADGAAAIEQGEGVGSDAGAIALFTAIAVLMLSLSSRGFGRRAQRQSRPSLSNPGDLV